MARILSSKLLAEVIYTIAQYREKVQNIKEKDYLSNQGRRLLSLIDKYFKCLLNEHEEREEEKSDSWKKNDY